MTAPPSSPGGQSTPPPSARTELELYAGMKVLGVRVEATATLATGEDTILSVRFRDRTLGDVLDYLVHLAEPGLNFSLPPPWDALNAIRLDDFAFEVDLTQFRIGFRYDGLGFTFPLASLDRIEVWYSPATRAKNKSLDISLFGSFLGIDFTSPPGLTWDALSQPAPAVPGKGPKYFDLEYLGIGQHVSLRDPATATTLAGVIAALEGSYGPVDRQHNPLAGLPALRFDPTAGWLVGTKFSALDTLTLAAVFNDPVLFGLRIALDGPRAKLLAGLAFEILYRRINDHLGVYHVELKLPDVLRKIEAGEATITLPIIDLDVYTNGDFLLDLGFPHNLDFSRSFSIDLIVWVGPIPVPVSAAGGLYFGVLSGESSTQVPAISNGRFAPVIVAGFGVRVGLGKSVSLGPLDAGFFAGIVGILEGVLAWFHPDDPSISPATYFKVRGTVGIQIHIWGRVDFSIIQASLDVLAYATASVAIESHQPIEVGFSAGVSVELSVKVLFFHITLRFSATITESFTIGQATPTPWQLDTAAAAVAAAQPQISRGLVMASGRPVQAQAAFASLLEAGVDWHARPDLVAAVAQPPRTLTLYAHLMATAARPDDRPGGSAGAPPRPALVTMLFLADRGQLEGALAVAHRDTPLTPHLTVALPDGTTHETAPGDTLAGLALRAGATAPAPDADVFALGWLNRSVRGLLAGSATQPLTVQAPEGFITADGAPVVVRDDTRTLTDLALAFLSPFEQLSREALLWAIESVDAGLAGGLPGAPLGPASTVTASHLHAVLLDLADLSRPLAPSRIVDFFTSRGIALELAAMPASARNPSYTVFPMPPFLTMTVPDQPPVDFGTQPYQAPDAYVKAVAAFVRDLTDPGPSPATSGQRSSPAAPRAGTAEPSSVTALLFSDWFTFLLRQVVQDALDVFRSVRHRPAAGSSETLSDIAAEYGLTGPGVAVLTQANKVSSTFYRVRSGATPGTRLTIADRVASVLDGETLRSLAARLQLTPLVVALAARDDSDLLAPGGTVTVSGGSCLVAPGDSLSDLATRLAVPLDVVVTAAARVPNLVKALVPVTVAGRSATTTPVDTLASLATTLDVALTDLGQAVADRHDLLFAGVAFPVPDISHVVAQDGPESLADIADRYRVPVTPVVAGANADTLALRAGARVVFGLPVSTRAGESLADLAARLDPDAASLTPLDIARVVRDQSGLLAPGAAILVNPHAVPHPPAGYVIRAGDTLASIAADFGTTPDALVAANPGVTWYPVPDGYPAPGMGIPIPVGVRIALPTDLTYRVRRGDTLAGIAAAFDISVAELLAPESGNDTSAQLLAGQVGVVLPAFSHEVQDAETPLAIAARYGLAVDALIAANPSGPFDTVLVPDAEVLPLADLLAPLTAAGAFDRPGGALARFFLHGLRLPAPDGIPASPEGTDWSGVQQYPMHTITGQQVTPPSPLPAGFALTLAVSAGTPHPAVTIAGGGDTLSVAPDQDAVAGIAARLGAHQPFDADPLSATSYPAAVVGPQLFALAAPVPWLAPGPVQLRQLPPPGLGGPLPTGGAAAGTPSLHAFPQPLRTRIAAGVAGGQSAPLRLVLQAASTTGGGSATDTVPVAGAGWATRLDVGLRRVPDPATAGRSIPYVYELFGAGAGTVDDLRLLLDHLRDGGSGETLDVRLLYATDPSTGSPGLRSDQLRPEELLLVKANLSTSAQPPAQAAALAAALATALAAGVGATAEAGPLAAASTAPAQARDFLTLVWEAAVTNSGGYLLLYRVGSSGADLPAYLFDQSRSGTITLLVTVLPAPAGTDAAPATIDVRPFHNTAIVTENLPDPTATVYVAPPRYPLPPVPGTQPPVPGTLRDLADALGLQVSTVGAANALVPNLLTTDQPVTVGSATYRVLPGQTLLDVAAALGASLDDVVAALADARGAVRPGTTLFVYPDWLTPRTALRPGAAGFRILRRDPDPAAVDPSTPAPGRTGQDDPATRLAVLFNLVGYALAAGQDFRPSGDGLPAGPAGQGDGALDGGATDAHGARVWTYAKQVRIDRFAIGQPAAPAVPGPDPYGGVGGTADVVWHHQDVFGNRILPPCTLPVPVRYTDALLGPAQWPSVVAVYRFTRASGSTGASRSATLSVRVGLDAGTYVAPVGDPVAPLGADGGPGVAAGLAARAAADRDGYAQVYWQVVRNVRASVATSLDGGVAHPVDSSPLADFAAASWRYLGSVAALRPLPAPTGGATLGTVAAAYQVSPAELAQANRSVAQNAAAAEILQPGAALRVEQRATVVVNETLTAISARASTGAVTPAALAAANPDVRLQPGVVLVLGRPGPAPTSGGTLAAFASAAGLSPLQWASGNELRTGLLAAGTTLPVPAGYRTAETDTLRTLAVRANSSLGDLVAALADVPDLLSPDARPALPVTWTPAPQDTLGSLAARFGSTAAQLVAVNADAGGLLRPGGTVTLPTGASTPVAAGETLAAIAGRTGFGVDVLATLNSDVPGLLGPGPLTAPYTTRDGDTLGTVAVTFPAVSLTPQDLGEANADLPGLLAAGADVLVTTSDYTIRAGDTFASIAKAQGVDVATIGTANADRSILAATQWLAVPRHAVLGDDVSATVPVAPGYTLGRLAAAHAADVAVLAAANADLVDLLPPGAEVRYLASTGATFTTTTRDGDTVSTLTARLQAALLAAAAPDHVTPARLGAANPDLPLVAGKRLLLPPADVSFDVLVAPSDDAALLDVDAALTLARTGAVDPTLADAPGVASVASPLAPDAGTGTRDDPLALVRFAQAFEYAFSDVPLKLATTTRAVDAPAGQQRLLAVRYRSAALGVRIDAGGASFHAPPPLSTQLWSSSVPVPIRPYTPGEPLGEERPTSFSGIDLDQWGRSFLTVLDRVLSSDHAIAAYTRDPAAYRALLAAKSVLAAAVSASVVPVVDPPPGAAAPDLDAARETLRQRLLVALAEAYQVDAIVQLPVAVTAPAQWSGDTAPRLHGEPRAGTYRVPEETVPTVAGDTLSSLAARTGTTLRALGEDNANLVGLLQPGVTLRPGDPAAAEWTTLVDESLDAFAARVDQSLADVVAAAADVPGLLRPDVDVAVPRATLGSVADRLGVPLQLLVHVVADQPYLLRVGAQLPGTPPRVVAAGPDGRPPTLAVVAQLLGTELADLGALLGDVPGLLARDAALNVVRRTYMLAADDTLFTALDVLALDLSTPQLLQSAVDDLAAMNATTSDLFAAGSALDVPTPYLVGAGDTLARIAAATGLTPAELGRSVAGRTDVLLPGVTLTVPGGTVLTTGSADSLEGLAARAKVPLDDMLTAAARLAGLLVPGRVWALPGPWNTTRHVVAEGETWQSIATSIAAALGAGSGPLVTPSWLLTTQLHVLGIVRRGAELGYLSRVPGFSLSGGSISLSGTGRRTLTLLFRSASNIRFSSLTLDLGFQVTQLEHDVATAPFAPGQRSSSWASFLVAPAEEPVGSVDVPIPIRAYPVPPSVIRQTTFPAATASSGPRTPPPALDEQRAVVALGDTAQSLAERLGVPPATVVAAAVRHAVLPRSVLETPPVEASRSGSAVALPAATVLPVPRLAGFAAGADSSPPDGRASAPALQEMRRYGYSYTFTCRRDAQDTITVGRELNAPPLEASVPRAGRTGNLPAALAQFASIRSALEADLALLAGAPPATAPADPEDGDPAVAALRVLAEISTAVAAGWTEWTAPPPPPPSPPGAGPALFRLRRGALPTGQTSLHVVPVAGASLPPTIDLRGHDREDVAMSATAAAPSRALFTRSLTAITDPGTGPVTLGAPAETLPGQDEYTVTVSDLDLTTAQNVWGDVRLARNATLLPGVVTNPVFVYAIPPARMPTPAIPLVSTAAPFDIAAVPFLPAGAPGTDTTVAGGRQGLATWLRNFLDSLLNRFAILPGDTMTGLAQRYATDLPAVGTALADVAGLLAPGATVALPGGDVTVATGDTLASVAASRSVSVADLALAVADVAGLLVAGALVRPAALRRTLRLSVDYAFVLATDPQADGGQRGEIVSRLPVLLQPAFLFDSAVDLAPASGFCADLATRLAQWAGHRGLDPERGSWIFDVSLYTTLPGDDADPGTGSHQIPPLLELRSAQLARSLVLPDPGGAQGQARTS